MKANRTLVNFVNGEWSPLMAARVDSEDYNKSLSWCQNFIVLPQGGVKYRPGCNVAGLAPGLAYTIPFQFSADDAIVIEATDILFRFYRNGALILNPNVTITGITNASPGVVTAPAHGFTNGQQVYISGVWGMPQINDRFFTVAGAATNTFTLQDTFGTAVNTTAYGVYSANGTVASVYTLVSPYAIADVPNLRYAQVGDVMYIVHPAYPPQKLVRTDFTSWAIGPFSRVNDPFTSGTNFNVSSITNSNPAHVTVTSAVGLANGDVIYLIGATGMSVLNHKSYVVENLVGTTFQLFDLNGNPVNTSGFGAYGGGATFQQVNNFPATVAFTSDGRLAYGNSRLNPQGLWGSELPSGTTTNYDNFTTGTTADKAYAFQFAPVNGIIDAIQELKQFGGMLAVLGASSILQAYGAQAGTPPTGVAIGTLPTIQGSAHVSPIAVNWDLIFVDVNQKKLRGLQFNFYYSAFETVDFNLNSPHFGDEAQFVKIVHVKGVPEIVWCLRADGVLLSFTFDNVTKVGAWARHYVGGAGRVIDICTIRNSSGDDQLYITVQRTINGQVFNTVEVMSAWADIPLLRSFFTGDEQGDRTNWQHAAWEQVKIATLLDMALTYNGTERGVQAGATVTPSAVTGNITLTASAAVFQPTDVGSFVWKFYNADGSGGGQAEITGYTDSTHVNATVLIDYDNTSAVPAGDWAFAIKRIVNLQLFAGIELGVQADGGAHPAVTVAANGSVLLEYPVSIAQFGFAYTGLVATQNLDLGTQTGPGNSKPRNIKRIRARVSDTFGGQLGSSEYDAQKLVFRNTNQPMNQPPAPFTGLMDVTLLDRWTNDTKQAVLVQTDPTPCTFIGLDIEVNTNDP